MWDMWDRASSGMPAVRFIVRMVEKIFWILASDGILSRKRVSQSCEAEGVVLASEGSRTTL